jgi:hypothetical protein
LTIFNPLTWITKKRAARRLVEPARPQLTHDEMKELAAAFDREGWNAEDKDPSEKPSPKPGRAVSA